MQRLTSDNICVFGPVAAGKDVFDSATATDTLFIGNAGPSVGVPISALIEALKARARPVMGDSGATDAAVMEASFAVPDSSRAFLFAIFADSAVASRALSLLTQEPVCGRQLKVNFATRTVKSRGSGHLPLDACECAAQVGIPGLHLLPDFVDEATEAEFLDTIKGAAWHNAASREVCHFGYAFDYVARGVDVKSTVPSIPAVCQTVLRRAEALPPVQQQLDQLTVNRYRAGVGLAPHVDAHSAFTGAILSLTLDGPTVMEFRRPVPGGSAARRALWLPRRSLLVMSGEARYAWEHYIPHRKRDRVKGEWRTRAPVRTSFTFRKARGFPCACAFPDMCDSQSSAVPATRLAQLGPPPCDVATGTHNIAREACGSDVTSGGTGCDRQQEPGDVCACAGAGSHGDGGVRGQAGGRASNEGSTERVARDCGGGAGSLGHAGAEAPLGRHSSSGAPGARADGAAGSGGEDDEALRRLEEAHVHHVYNAIARHFSATRFAIWPAVRTFLDSFPAGAMVADFGCGNGKYTTTRRDVAVLGTDRCAALVYAAATRLHAGTAPDGRPAARAPSDVAVADAFSAPYRRGSCDGALCVAVLHHVASEARRLRLLAALRDALAPGGRALVTVWAREQEDPSRTLHRWTALDVATRGVRGCEAGCDHSHTVRSPSVGDGCAVEGAEGSMASGAGPGGGRAGRRIDGAGRGGRGGAAERSPGATADYLVPWHLPWHRAEAHMAAGAAARVCGASEGGRSPPSGVRGDEGARAGADGVAVGVLDEARRSVRFERYYHVFAEGELGALVGRLPGVRLLHCCWDASNWVAEFVKLSS